MSEWPRRCADVTYDMADEHLGEPEWDANLGDLLWNPKAGEGHVLVTEARCGTGSYGRYGTKADCGCGGWTGPCDSLTLICECGLDDSCRDHHYKILARAGSSGEGGPT